MRTAGAFVALLATPLPIRGQPPASRGAQSRGSDTIRVLFIGNSYTYFNNLPAQLSGLATSDSGGRPIVTGMLAPGGMTLRGHLDGGRVDSAVRARRWDIVVVQEQSALANPVRRGSSTEPGTPERFHAAARTLDSLVRRSGARTVLYQTWARADQPQHTATIAAAYESLAAELGIAMAPVGRAFAMARAERPDLQLHLEDGSHPTAAGSYLAACVLYGTLTGRPVEGLSGRLTGRAITHDGEESPTESAVRVSLDERDARFLQDVAARALRGGRRR